ncbi:hypothetical protein [Silvanigrella aquatica]|uniref:Uncharacterized protein n=1 Tax=Silvanigrella aquatica TaxID=1915309 RepID=A0A1L4D3B1_9BACT|nr:hypothetical protein [Silvanigrella aquatica]APJ04696.1 hypothetical protein AXG55_12605 [Silvanigrella aquatica]
MILIKYILFLICLNLICINSVFSLDKTYVICSNKTQNWYWLKDENNNYIQVLGKWEEWKYEINNHYAIFKYFIPENSYNKLLELSQKCIESYGIDYLSPQPSDNYSSRWSLFAINKDLILSGIVITDFEPTIRIDDSMIIRHSSYGNIFSLRKNNTLNFLKNDLIINYFKRFY